MPEAARVGDAIGHSPAAAGLLTGLLIGASVGVAAVAIVGTGGLAAAAIVGGMAAAGGGIMEVISTMSFVQKQPTGAIATGSGDVFINGKRAARAQADTAVCHKHSRPRLVAEGSGNVYINGHPAARLGDKIDCGAVAIEGSGNVFIGGGTQQTDVIVPEDLVPGWVHGTLLVVGVGSAVALAGPSIALGGLIGGALFGVGGEWLGGKVFGQGSDGQKWSMLTASFAGGLVGVKGGASGSAALAEWSTPQIAGNVGGSGSAALMGESAAATATPNGAALPLGGKRLQLNQPANPAYQPIRNDATTIGRVGYSGHAIDRMQDRGVMPSVVQNTIDTGSAKPARLGTTIYYDPVNNLSVVTNAQGKVVTVKYGR